MTGSYLNLHQIACICGRKKLFNWEIRTPTAKTYMALITTYYMKSVNFLSIFPYSFFSFRTYFDWLRLASHKDLPGQGVKHDFAVSVPLPTHDFPPFIGGGLLHDRLLWRISPPDIPHVLEHVVHGLQTPHSPSIGPAKEDGTED